MNVIITSSKEKVCAKVNLKCVEFSGRLPGTWCRRCQLQRKKNFIEEDQQVKKDQQVKDQLEKTNKDLTTVDRMQQTRAWKKRNNNREIDNEMLEWPRLWDDVDQLGKEMEITTKSGEPPRPVMDPDSDSDSEATIPHQAVGAEGVEGVWQLETFEIPIPKEALMPGIYPTLPEDYAFVGEPTHYDPGRVFDRSRCAPWG
jgi:hypothetical protein